MTSSSNDRALRRLQETQTAEQLIRYFIDELAWPMEDDALLDDPNMEGLMFDWDLAELGIQPEERPVIERVRQVRPFTSTQPWGIFIVELAGRRLLITQIRKLLNQLVTKKRSARDPNRRTWALDDLIFLVTTGENPSEMHLLVFYEVEGKADKFLSLSWRPTDPTRRLRRLADELLPQLTWPDNTHDTEAWKNTWRQPFTLQPGETITSAARLADRMARSARHLRQQISDSLAAENGTGPFSKLMSQIREQLVADVTADNFSGMCAQTLVYGLLSSRVSDPEGFGATPVLSVVPLSNPFLAAFFQQVHDEASALDLGDSNLEKLVADLKATDVEAILDEFGSTAKGGDPVIHFYEEFLKQYDPAERIRSGAFYTPQPVVEQMVRFVDEILRTRFGLPMGVADPSTWSQVAQQNDFSVLPSIQPDEPFVSIIDPATGTGTFLVEWINQAKRSFIAKRPEKEWSAHLQAHVLPALHAFEIALGPYAIAHLKVALELSTHGVIGAHTNILLTDTLRQSKGAQGTLDLVEDPVAVEGIRAAQVKETAPISVVIGNPPYLKGAGGRGGWVEKGERLATGDDAATPVLDDWRPPKDWGVSSGYTKELSNLYVFFWRWGTWKVFGNTGKETANTSARPGIVSFITTTGFLTGPGFQQMRAWLRGTCTEIWVLHLTPEGHQAPPDMQVFEQMRQPVAIVTAVRNAGTSSKAPAVVRYLQVAPGKRENKFAELATITPDDPGWDTCLDWERAPFLPGSEGYLAMPPIEDLLPWSHNGVSCNRTWPISPSKPILKKRWETLIEAETASRKRTLLKETPSTRLDWKPTERRHLPGFPNPRWALADETEECANPIPYAYRSFDRQYLIPDVRTIHRPRPPLWYVRQAPGQVYLTRPQIATENLRPLIAKSRGSLIAATQFVPDMDHNSAHGGGRTHPLWRDPLGPQPNIVPGLLDYLQETCGLPVSAETFLAYVVGVMAHPDYTAHFREDLQEATSLRVPLTASATLWAEAVELGSQVIWLHTYGERYHDPRAGRPHGPPQVSDPARRPKLAKPIPPPADRHPNGVQHHPDTNTLGLLDIEGNTSGTVANVTPAVRAYEIGPMNVLDSWFKYRKRFPDVRRSSDLNDITPQGWPTQYTQDLLELLNVLTLLTDLEPAQAKLLQAIVEGPKITIDDLHEAGVLPPPATVTKPPKVPKPLTVGVL